MGQITIFNDTKIRNDFSENWHRVFDEKATDTYTFLKQFDRFSGIWTFFLKFCRYFDFFGLSQNWYKKYLKGALHEKTHAVRILQ